MDTGSDPFPPPVPPPVPEAAAEALTVTPAAEPAAPAPSPLQELLKNPLVLAGGALVAGMLLSRLMASQSARRMATDIAEEALRRVRAGGTVPPPAAPGAGAPASPGTLVDEVVERFRPQVTDYAKKILADFLRKKE